MREAVLDASVVLKWFRSEGERHAAAARSLRAQYEAGDLLVFAPPLLGLEVINVAGRRWSWEKAGLISLAAALDQLGFLLRGPELHRVARWTARGLTAYDAAYLGVAEAEGVPLITDDDLILAVAPEIAVALAETAGTSSS